LPETLGFFELNLLGRIVLVWRFNEIQANLGSLTKCGTKKTSKIATRKRAESREENQKGVKGYGSMKKGSETLENLLMLV